MAKSAGTKKSPFLGDDFVGSGPVDNSVLSFIADAPIPPDARNPHSTQTVIYRTIKGLDGTTGITGIRADRAASDSVVITASTELASGETVAAVYGGTLQALPNAPTSRWHVLKPEFAGQEVEKSIFYGPNTSLFDPSLGTNNIRAVGSYQAGKSPVDHGMIYEGPITGGGTWTQIDATSLVSSGHVRNTIPHSTMGTLVVGNYDIDSDLSPGHAFVYDMADKSWKDFNPTGSLSITAYGIWQNGGSNSTSYTIAGGFSDLASGDIDKGYVVDYDSATRQYSHLAIYQFTTSQFNDSLVSHFDGIAATANGYNLTGEFLDPTRGGTGGFFASITRMADGTFSAADWTAIGFPDATVTSGNTIIGNTVLGIHAPGDNGLAFSSYIATVLHS